MDVGLWHLYSIRGEVVAMVVQSASWRRGRKELIKYRELIATTKRQAVSGAYVILFNVQCTLKHATQFLTGLLVHVQVHDCYGDQVEVRTRFVYT